MAGGGAHTDRIRLADLRAETVALRHYFKRHPGRHDGVIEYHHDPANCMLCALIDAAEAAHAVRDPDADYTHDEGVHALMRLDAALSAFDFAGRAE